MHPQDRRLFDFPLKKLVIMWEESRHDFEYSLLFNKYVFSTKKLNTSIGIGYSINQMTFSRPFDHHYFPGVKTEDLKLIQRYLTHHLAINFSEGFTVSEKNGHSFYFLSHLVPKFVFRKHVKSQSKFSKWLFQSNTFELYLGMGLKLKKIDIGLSYRVLNFQKIDPVIFNNNLYHTSNPPILQKKYEFINLAKIKLTLSYILGINNRVSVNE